jgi:hypothetical protein
MKPQSPENSGETYSAADLPFRQAGLLGIKPSAFGGIIRPNGLKRSSRFIGTKLFDLQISMHCVFEI